MCLCLYLMFIFIFNFYFPVFTFIFFLILFVGIFLYIFICIFVFFVFIFIFTFIFAFIFTYIFTFFFPPHFPWWKSSRPQDQQLPSKPAVLDLQGTDEFFPSEGILVHPTCALCSWVPAALPWAGIPCLGSSLFVLFLLNSSHTKTGGTWKTWWTQQSHETQIIGQDSSHMTFQLQNVNICLII